jgi:hypothetical protein
MRTATLIAVDQRFDFRSGKILSYAVFEFRGKEMRTEIDNVEEVKQLINVGLNGQSQQEEVTPHPGATPTPAGDMQPKGEALFTPEVSPQEAEDEDPDVAWAEVEEDLIPPGMKKALAALQAPPVMALSALERLMNDVMEKFTPEQWEAVLHPPQTASVPQPQQRVPATPQVVQPPQPVQPVAGAVTWADGRPILPGTQNRGRTVQADEWGYPIVDDAGIDPGEIVGTGDDVDEDGVGQL